MMHLVDIVHIWNEMEIQNSSFNEIKMLPGLILPADVELLNLCRASEKLTAGIVGLISGQERTLITEIMYKKKITKQIPHSYEISISALDFLTYFNGPGGS